MSLTTPLSIDPLSFHCRCDELLRDRLIGKPRSALRVMFRQIAGLLSVGARSNDGVRLGLLAIGLLTICFIQTFEVSAWGQETLRRPGSDGRALPPLRTDQDDFRVSAASSVEETTEMVERVGSSESGADESRSAIALSPPEGRTAPRNSGLSIDPPKQAREPRGTPFSLPADVPRNTLLALGLVIGAFLILALFVKRHQPRSFAPLPGEAVELLGRLPLDQKQHLQLIRLGRKLVLIAVSSSGCTTVSEVTEPAEVEHLLTLCQSRRGGSASEAFRQVLTRAEKEPPGAGFLGNPSSGKNSGLAQDDGDSRRRRAWFEA